MACSPSIPNRSNLILAYIDSGSGSILIQVVLASCIGGIAVFWSKIKALFSGRKTEEPQKPEEPQ